jgi:shikimate dehydrogenase
LKTLSGKTKAAGVIGWPVDHSLSPRLHGYWLALHGIDGVYLPFATKPERLAEAIRALPALGLRGANVTLPHKERALDAVDRASAQARRIGAVNTLVVEADGSVSGDNTDAYGFMEHLKDSAPQWQAQSGPAVVLGAGGAARAVAMALIEAGVSEIRLVNRTLRRAEEMAAAIGGPVRVMAWEERGGSLKDAGLLVNTTRLGMQGQPKLEIDLGTLPKSAVVNDIVYAPLETELLAVARRRGHPLVDGIGMLLHQARPGFEAWFGVAPKVTPQLRAFVLGLGA